MQALNAAMPVAASAVRMVSSRRVGRTRGDRPFPKRGKARAIANRASAAAAYRNACPVSSG